MSGIWDRAFDFGSFAFFLDIRGQWALNQQIFISEKQQHSDNLHHKHFMCFCFETSSELIYFCSERWPIIIKSLRTVWSNFHVFLSTHLVQCIVCIHHTCIWADSHHKSHTLLLCNRNALEQPLFTNHITWYIVAEAANLLLSSTQSIRGPWWSYSQQGSA